MRQFKSSPYTRECFNLCSHRECLPYFINLRNCLENVEYFNLWWRSHGLYFKGDVPVILVCLPPSLPPSLLPWLHKEIGGNYDKRKHFTPRAACAVGGIGSSGKQGRNNNTGGNVMWCLRGEMVVKRINLHREHQRCSPSSPGKGFTIIYE